MLSEFKERGLLKAIKATLGIGSLLLISACGPLISFGGDGDADEVYSLEYQGGYSTFNADAPRIYLDEPLMAEGLASRKMSVRLPDFRRSAIASTSWSANLSDLIRGYMARSIAVKSGVQLISEGGLDVKVGCRMAVHVWAFELVPGDIPQDDKVASTIELTLLNVTNGVLLGKQTFVVEKPVLSAGGAAIAAAFNQAIEDSANKMSEWLIPIQSGCVLGEA
ncbi:ABC-type transport auxiliary lipoprotein family protein [Kordiimonas sp. SCSIO 12610]|uniref:ABC-type transport auxiliary lipoprotein family protein n=1 Tax=Kordiimonas sp. SCSIO 12610 TaxID=2829597 RepID=UPI002109A7EB|nr:ABC-type transport auxiliary lipoprotein family protein [Kordiimonas sp. SCSIO 12610]UTW55162.1 membrane integrity-associated transporter subunit PqiC [Kordiimonas sp. SCSIO 12610]